MIWVRSIGLWCGCWLGLAVLIPAQDAPAPAAITKTNVVAGAPPAVVVPTAAERAGFDAAIRDFDAGFFSRAATSFAEFEAAHPESTLKPESEIRRRYAQAAAERKPLAAAEQLAAFARENVAAPLALSATIRAARLWLEEKRADLALAALDFTAEPLAGAEKTGKARAELLAALLLRTQAALQSGQAAVAIRAAEQAASWIDGAPQELAYDRLRLLLEARLAGGAPDAAVTAGEQLQSLTAPGGLTNRRPEAVALLGRALLRADNRPRALTVFSENLAPGTPVPLLREATLQVADADRLAGRLPAARVRLEAFLAAHPNDPQLDRIRWTLGQTLFWLYQSTRLTPTNDPTLLVLAETQLSGALTNAPAEFRGDLQLLRGWCLWEGASGTNQLVAAGDAFAEAIALLPRSADQATANFKLGDVRFRQGLPALALTNFLHTAEGYAGVFGVESNLVTMAWQNAAAAAIAATNAPVAERALARLIEREPRAEATGQGLLQLNSEYTRQDMPARGRTLLEQFVARFPDSPMRWELELAIADAFRREELWPLALAAYDRWLAGGTNLTLRPRAEFGRVHVLAHTTGYSNAVAQFQTFVQRYPADPLAQTALLWLGDHYFQQAEFRQAEEAFTAVLTNAAWTGLRAPHDARLGAAKAAMAWKQYGRAFESLRALLNDPTTPADLLPDGFFTLGRALLQAPPVNPQEPLAPVSDALDAFKAVTTFTNSPLVPEAWLAMADCHRQLAGRTPASFAAANELYLRVLDPRHTVEPWLRAGAKLGLGQLALQEAVTRPPDEAAALTEAALNHFLDVALGKLITVTGPLEANVLRDAGFQAGLLLEARQDLAGADALYARLGSELPALRSQWEERRAKLKAVTPAADRP